MRFRSRSLTALFAALVIVIVVSCQKSEDEAPQPVADESAFDVQVSELISYTLDNGISVYLQQETAHNQIAFEVLYRAGFAHEPAGQVQVSHIAEHAVLFAATASYPAGAAAELISRDSGMLSAEAVGDFVHFDYVVEKKHLEDLLKVESERLTSVQIDDRVREEQARKAAGEISSVLAAERGTLKKFGLMTVLHALQHGDSFVPIMQANQERTVEELNAFHKQCYRPGDMVIVLVGNFEIDTARALIDKYFGPIPSTPEPPRFQIKADKNVSVKWDIDASAVCLAYPGPYDVKENAALVIFGSYLSQHIARSPDIPALTNATFTTNPTYTVEYMPFFVYGDPARYRSVMELRDMLVRLTDEAIAAFNEPTFQSVKASIRRYIASSYLESSVGNIQLDHYQIIGQHALNIGMKHYLRGGLSPDEYLAMIDGLTFEDLQSILADRLGEDDRTIVMISGM